jgi:hypothetical protein
LLNGPILLMSMLNGFLLGGFGDISTVLCLWLHTSMSLLSRSAIVVNMLNANDPEISR